jgi:hypothetical protein
MRRMITLLFCISSSCIAIPVEYNDVDVFKTELGSPLHTVDFEILGDGTTIPRGDYPVQGDEWANWGVQFTPREAWASLFLYDPLTKPEYVSEYHVLAVTGDSSSFTITFTETATSFGMWIVDSEWTSINEKIIIKEESGVLTEFPVPAEGSLSTSFRGYYSDIGIVEVCIIEDSDGEGLTLDDVMFTPEPGAVLLLGLGGMFLKHRSAFAEATANKLRR